MLKIISELSPDYNFSPAPRFPRICTSLLNRASDLLWEVRLGIRTIKGAPSPHPDARHYGCLAYNTYFRILNRLALKPEDVVVDIGAGKGRVVCLAATKPVKEVIGVEIDPDLCEHGNRNAARMRGRRAPVRFVCQSAAEFDFRPANKIVLISPFGEETMEKTLGQIEESLKAAPRRLLIAYGNPVLSPMMAAKKWLKLHESWHPGKWCRVKFPVHFYRSTIAVLGGICKKLTEFMEAAVETLPYCPV